MNVIRCIASGKIKEAHAAENKRVNAGELLYLIESETLNEQEHFLQDKIAQKQSLIVDVEVVIGSSKIPLTAKSIFNSAIYQQSYFTYQQKLIEAQTVYNKAKQAHDRHFVIVRSISVISGCWSGDPQQLGRIISS